MPDPVPLITVPCGLEIYVFKVISNIGAVSLTLTGSRLFSFHCKLHLQEHRSCLQVLGRRGAELRARQTKPRRIPEPP